MDNATLRAIDLRRLQADRTHPVKIVPDAADCANIAARLGLLGLRKLRLEATLLPEGKSDWRLNGQLGATVVQPCVVTLNPVSTRIDEDFTRLFSAAYAEPEADEDEEIEMPDDDTVEPLPDRLNLFAVLEEVLALNIPLYPRAADAKLESGEFTEPGKAAMTDEDAKPFASLAELKKRLEEE